VLGGCVSGGVTMTFTTVTSSNISSIGAGTWPAGCMVIFVLFASIFMYGGCIETGPTLAVAPDLRAHARVGPVSIGLPGAGHGQKITSKKSQTPAVSWLHTGKFTP
jgi:hypothetical protein